MRKPSSGREVRADSHADRDEDPVTEAVELLTKPLPPTEPDRSREAARRAEMAARVLAAAAG